MSPATPSERSTSWQNWWVVAIVAASKPASASRSRQPALRQLVVGRRSTRWLSSSSSAPSAGSSSASAGLDQLVADPLAQLLAGRPAEGDEQHVVEQRLALGDVAGDQAASA